MDAQKSAKPCDITRCAMYDDLDGEKLRKKLTELGCTIIEEKGIWFKVRFPPDWEFTKDGDWTSFTDENEIIRIKFFHHWEAGSYIRFYDAKGKPIIK